MALPHLQVDGFEMTREPRRIEQGRRCAVGCQLRFEGRQSLPVQGQAQHQRFIGFSIESDQRGQTHRRSGIAALKLQSAHELQGIHLVGHLSKQHLINDRRLVLFSSADADPTLITAVVGGRVFYDDGDESLRPMTHFALFRSFAIPPPMGYSPDFGIPVRSPSAAARGVHLCHCFYTIL